MEEVRPVYYTCPLRQVRSLIELPLDRDLCINAAISFHHRSCRRVHLGQEALPLEHVQLLHSLGDRGAGFLSG